MKNEGSKWLGELRANSIIYLDTISELRDFHKVQPAENSQAATELTESIYPGELANVHSIANMLINNLVDHFSAVIQLYEVPVHIFAPWTCARSTIESSAWAKWLLDDSLDANDRASRGYGWRFQILREQLRFANAGLDLAKKNENEEGIKIRSENKLRSEERIQVVVEDAKKSGFAPIYNKKDVLIGIGVVAPSISDLVEQMLSLGEEYRIFSGIAHGNTSTMRELGYQIVDNDERESYVFVEPSVTVNAVGIVIGACFRATQLAFASYANLYGYESRYLDKTEEEIGWLVRKALQ